MLAFRYKANVQEFLDLFIWKAELWKERGREKKSYLSWFASTMAAMANADPGLN